ncbi:DUF4112 domain-containing protein [Thiohalomonas denitrificans]|uniref:DUF4112 domain-containing protein n=1 Tax=Thiohalomonas denitrificans TaxID=415747 RepID=UPI0026EC35F0|nr:DUF4112 domain-containing protein [Thiohalomonas denitrificans]
MSRTDSKRDRETPERPELRHADLLSRWMDDIVRLPGGFRIGLDGIIGLIPGVGDAAGAVVSSVIVGQAARFGVPAGVLLRMIGNILIETIIGSIPVLGDLFDFAWKANLKNFDLLKRHMGEASVGERGTQRLAYTIMAVVALAILAVIALVYLFVLMLAKLF